MAAAASPDGRSIAIDLLGAHLDSSASAAARPRRITPELLEARQPTWSPDSQSIAFQGYDDGTWHIYVIPRDGGEAKAITNGVFDDREPVWSHDGIAHRLLVGSLRRHHDHLDGHRRQRRGAQLSTRDGWMPTWSPNDQEMTFVSARCGAAAAPGRSARRDCGR